MNMSTQLPSSRSLARGAVKPLPRQPAMARFEQQEAYEAAHIQGPSGGDEQYEAIASSSCGDGKGRVPETARPLRLQCNDCEELLHELANVITGVLMQSQMVAWKLPPYSHLKRSIREIERNAQRGGELMKRIMRRFGDDDESASGEGPAVAAGAREARTGERSRPHKRL